MNVWSKKDGFYKSKEWRKVRMLALQRDHYLCQDCLKSKRITKATEVHHIKSLKECPELALCLENLRSLCWNCHERTKKKSYTRPARVRVIDMKEERRL